MSRLARLAPALLLLVAACPKDKKDTPPPPLAQDTTPLNFDSVQTAIPPAAPDTFTPPKVHRQPPIPSAPPELVDAVEREQSFSKFCYQEFGQKVDPSLAGGVAMVVTVESSGISEAHVVDDTWSSKAGKQVNSCLNDKAAKAWKAASGTIKPGKYVVQLSFRPT